MQPDVGDLITVCVDDIKSVKNNMKVRSGTLGIIRGCNRAFHGCYVDVICDKDIRMFMYNSEFIVLLKCFELFEKDLNDGA